MQESGLLLVDFYATWCGPCNSLATILLELEKKNDQIKIFKMNVDENFDVPQKYQVSVLPTMVFFKDGKVVKTLVGLQNESSIQKVIDEYAST
jgi:thioredoxin 1